MRQIEMFGKYGDGKFVLLDDDDFDWINQFTWHVDWRGYAVRNVWVVENGEKRCKTIQMHVIINNTPDGFQTDHKNRSRLDNQKHNLRTSTPLGNARNTSRKTNSKKFKGVFKTRSGKWMVSTHINYKIQCHGTYESEDFAARVYDYVAHKEFGEYANLNFPNEVPTEQYNPENMGIQRRPR